MNLNTLSQTKIPNVVAKLRDRGFLDSCNIETHTPTQSTSGATVKGNATNAYIDVPAILKSVRKDFRQEQAGKVRSVNEYTLTIPRTLTDGQVVEFDIKKHRIRVKARGNHPEKVLRPISYETVLDVLLKITCDIEN